MRWYFSPYYLLRKKRKFWQCFPKVFKLFYCGAKKKKKKGNLFFISCLWLPLSGSIFFRRLHITFATFDRKHSLSMLHTASKICVFVNTCPGLAARQQSAPYSKQVRGMSVPSFSTRRWCNLISNPGKVSAGEWGGCMASSGIILARAAMAFSTVFLRYR